MKAAAAKRTLCRVLGLRLDEILDLTIQSIIGFVDRDYGSVTLPLRGAERGGPEASLQLRGNGRIRGYSSHALARVFTPFRFKSSLHDIGSWLNKLRIHCEHLELLQAL